MILQGCVTDNTFVTLQDAAKSFPRAQYQILGKTRNDQIWIAKTIEAEVAGFGFARPAKRPASWDAPINVAPKATPKPLITHHEPTTQEVPVPTSTPAPTTMQTLRDKIKALNEKVRKLEGR